MRYSNGLCLVLVYFFLESCSSSRTAITPRTTISDPIQKNIFSDFKLLNTPRANINLGSEWVSGVGPSNTGLPETDISHVQSLSNYSFEENNSFNIGLKLNILNLLGIKANYEAAKNYNLTIDSASIVRVANLDKLNYSVGSSFIWEGIKVKSISLVTSRGKADTIAVNLKKLNKGLEVDVNQGWESTKRVAIKGFDLYCAYRLVTFSGLVTMVYDDVILNKTTGLDKEKLKEYIKGFEIGGSYVGRFIDASTYISQNYESQKDFLDEQKSKSIWPVDDFSDNYQTILEIKSNLELVDRSPKKVKVKVGSSGFVKFTVDPPSRTTEKNSDIEFENYLIALSTKVEGNNLVREVLEIKNLYFYANKFLPEIQFIQQQPEFIHKKHFTSIKNANDENVPGW